MITVVRINKGKNKFYEVVLSNKESLRVSEDMLVRYRLLKDRELSEDEILEIKKKAGFDLGLQWAMNYISYQLRSKKEVRDYLREKEISSEDQQQIIAHLESLHLVDDKIYGESYVRTQMRLSDKGPTQIIQQLKQKGLDEMTIQDVMGLYEKDQQFEVAFHAAEKASRKYKTKSHKETLQKIRLHLMQKGFSAEVISLVLEELPLEKDDDQEQSALQKEGERLLRRHQRLPLAKKRQKIKQGLYQKGFDLDLIQVFLDEELIDE